MPLAIDLINGVCVCVCASHSLSKELPALMNNLIKKHFVYSCYIFRRYFSILHQISNNTDFASGQHYTLDDGGITSTYFALDFDILLTIGDDNVKRNVRILPDYSFLFFSDSVENFNLFCIH